MKIRLTRFCVPVPNECTALKREAVFKKSAQLVERARRAPRPHPLRGSERRCEDLTSPVVASSL
jgi:hypothetical protein